MTAHDDAFEFQKWWHDQYGTEPQIGGSSNGRTEAFGTSNRGSIPRPPAIEVNGYIGLRRGKE